MSETLPAVDTPDPHPIRIVVTDDLQRNRLTILFRLILAIPAAIVTSVLQTSPGSSRSSHGSTPCSRAG